MSNILSSYEPLFKLSLFKFSHNERMTSIDFTYSNSERSEETPAENPPVLITIPGWETGCRSDHYFDIFDKSAHAICVSYS